MEQSKKCSSEEQFESLYKKAKYQMELEGFVFTKEDKEAIRKVYFGEMTRDELIERLKNSESTL